MAYDRKCYALAAAFIEDHPELRAKTSDLAVEIQETIDTWIDDQQQLNRIDVQVRAIANP